MYSLHLYHFSSLCLALQNFWEHWLRNLHQDYKHINIMTSWVSELSSLFLICSLRQLNRTLKCPLMENDGLFFKFYIKDQKYLKLWQQLFYQRPLLGNICILIGLAGTQRSFWMKAIVSHLLWYQINWHANSLLPSNLLLRMLNYNIFISHKTHTQNFYQKYV